MAPFILLYTKNRFFFILSLYFSIFHSLCRSSVLKIRSFEIEESSVVAADNVEMENEKPIEQSERLESESVVFESDTTQLEAQAPAMTFYEISKLRKSQSTADL